ncbi:MAG: HD domain-containing protein [Spirochaetales bacterium]|nr:HD domain-containing protein [Spirochaetales bacterium]
MDTQNNLENFTKQLDFIREIDKVKSIFRQTPITDKSRKENDAEHSWHLAMMAMILSEYAPEGTNILRVIKMVLIHDLVEIDAGDTYLFDEAAQNDKAEREQKAADRIFGILPEESSKEIMNLWHEFEERKTQEADFAYLMDRFQPFILNITTEGISWLEHGIKASQVLTRITPAVEKYPLFMDYLNKNVKMAVEKGWLKEG